MATSVASSSQRGIPGKPSVTAALKTNATVIAREMSVIIPGSRPRSSPMAPFRNGCPPYTKTAVPNAGAIHCEPGNIGALNPNARSSMCPQITVGTVSARVIQNRSRNIATLCPACLS